MRARAWWTAVILTVATPVVAQQGPPERGPQPRGMGLATPGVERNIRLALERAEALGLAESDIQALRGMQEEMAGVRQGLDQERDAFRERIATQDRELRETRRAEAQALHERRLETLRPFQERFDGMMSDAQRNQLREWARQDLRRGRGPGLNQGRRGAERIRGVPGVRGRGIGRSGMGSRVPAVARARALRNPAAAARIRRFWMRNGGLGPWGA